MSRARRPTFSHPDKQAFLRSLGETRALSTKCSSAEPYGSDLYNKCDILRAAIDALAEHITGDRTHFHLKGHGTRTKRGGSVGTEARRARGGL